MSLYNCKFCRIKTPFNQRETNISMFLYKSCNDDYDPCVRFRYLVGGFPVISTTVIPHNDSTLASHYWHVTDKRFSQRKTSFWNVGRLFYSIQPIHQICFKQIITSSNTSSLVNSSTQRLKCDPAYLFYSV